MSEPTPEPRYRLEYTDPAERLVLPALARVRAVVWFLRLGVLWDKPRYHIVH